MPEFDKRFSILPDQLVTRQDVPAAGWSREDHGSFMGKTEVQPSSIKYMNINANEPANQRPDTVRGSRTALGLDPLLLWRASGREPEGHWELPTAPRISASVFLWTHLN